MKKPVFSLVGPVFAALLLGSAVLGTAGAQVEVNKFIAYQKKVDPITDLNTSSIYVFEVNDVGGDTALVVNCADDGEANTWASFGGKNEILPVDKKDKTAYFWPDVTVRFDKEQPFTIAEADLYPINSDTRQLGFDGKSFDKMLVGLRAGKKMVIRLSGGSLRQPLDYTFSAQKFDVAWKGVNACK